MPRRVGSSLALLLLLKATMIWGRRAREATSWDCTEPGTGRSHCWCSPLVTLLRWAEFELLTSKVLSQSMKSVIVTLQPLITQDLGGKCRYLFWKCFWTTESYLCWDVMLLLLHFTPLLLLWPEDLENRAHLCSATFYKFETSFSLPCLLFCMSGPCCYPLVFLQLVFSLSHSDKVSSYHHNPHVHLPKKLLRETRCRSVHKKLPCAPKSPARTKTLLIQSLSKEQLLCRLKCRTWAEFWKLLP